MKIDLESHGSGARLAHMFLLFYVMDSLLLLESCVKKDPEAVFRLKGKFSVIDQWYLS